ncbi:hypothetical protein KIW84_075570 [Lathyrus oleraceus]|uniref:DUF4216 domain-containing protein n=1 Tax=Pisum sativum TaxID=3888 RepID=A0A9D5A186_PEA|nr:hypothetical protein KIW84_075570 [Pisum sativum]
MKNMAHDAFGFTQSSQNNLRPSSENNNEGRNSTWGEDKAEFFELLKDVNLPLYEGCKWDDTTRDRGYKKDSWGFSSVNFSRSIHTSDDEEHDTYIEASQAQMVYYVKDEIDKKWSYVVHLKPTDYMIWEIK